MATFALPRLPAARLPAFRLPAVLARPAVGVAAAAGLLLVAGAGVIALLAPGTRHDAVHVSLGKTISAAPKGWTQALRPAKGPPAVTQDVFQLSERVLPRLAGPSWTLTAPPPPRPLQPGDALPTAPVAGLFSPGPGGPLPIIAADGRTPFDAYRRPFLSNGRPKVAIIVGGLGLNDVVTRAAIESLPPEVTLAFAPYADGLQAWIDQARARGHEVLLETPLEPVDYPDNDPGPYTLLTDASPTETVRTLEVILSRGAGYFGLINRLGSRFLSSDPAYRSLATVARGRGLAFIDDGQAVGRTGGGLPRASVDRAVDNQPAAPAIADQLSALEASALQHGQALGSGGARPVTVDSIARWAQGLEQRGFQLAPASALSHR